MNWHDVALDALILLHLHHHLVLLLKRGLELILALSILLLWGRFVNDGLLHVFIILTILLEVLDLVLV